MWQYIGAEEAYQNYLAHYGVIGMKWGVRRIRKQDNAAYMQKVKAYDHQSDARTSEAESKYWKSESEYYKKNRKNKDDDDWSEETDLFSQGSAADAKNHRVAAKQANMEADRLTERADEIRNKMISKINDKGEQYRNKAAERQMEGKSIKAKYNESKAKKMDKQAARIVETKRKADKYIKDMKDSYLEDDKLLIKKWYGYDLQIGKDDF